VRRAREIGEKIGQLFDDGGGWNYWRNGGHDGVAGDTFPDGLATTGAQPETYSGLLEGAEVSTRERGMVFVRAVAVEKRRVSVNLPVGLLQQAQAGMGTKGIAQTLIRALEEAVNRSLRMQLLSWDFSSLNEETVTKMRWRRGSLGAAEMRVGPRR
jgi:hypothetical protein